MHESEPRSGSPLVQLALLVPDASFAIARDLQRAAFGAVRSGAAAVLDAVVGTPVIESPSAVVDGQVGSLARNGSQPPQADVLRFGVVLQRAEPMLVELLERVVEILPIDALLARIDVDALIRRVDVNALVARVDLQQVLAGIEIGDLIHDSTNSIASDVRDTVRGGAVSVDGRIARVVDRIVRRGRERDLVVPGYAFPGVP